MANENKPVDGLWVGVGAGCLALFVFFLLAGGKPPKADGPTRPPSMSEADWNQTVNLLRQEGLSRADAETGARAIGRFIAAQEAPSGLRSR